LKSAQLISDALGLSQRPPDRWEAMLVRPMPKSWWVQEGLGLWPSKFLEATLLFRRSWRTQAGRQKRRAAYL